MTKLLRRHFEDFACGPSVSEFLLRNIHEMSQFQYTVRNDNFVLIRLS